MKKTFSIIAICIFIAITIGVIMKTEKTEETAAAQNPVDNYFDQYISEDFYNQIKAGNFNRNIYPKFSDRKAWAKARKSKYADMIIKKADAALKAKVPQLLYSEYHRYAEAGDRKGYEQLFFERRANLGYLTVAMCLTGDKAKYMPKILDYTVAVLEEFTWVVPAHTYWKGENYQQLGDVMNTDLCASSTGAMMAIIYHVIGEELDKEFENITEKIRRITLARTVYNVFYNPEPYKIGQLWWFKLDGKKNNWTPWCSYNNILTAIILEKDTEKLAYFIRRYLQANAHFVNKYGDDGYCNEGPTYYSYAGLKLFEIFHILHKIRPNSMEKVFAVPKIRAIFEFIANVRIGDKYQINFADSSAAFTPKLEGIAVCGKLMNSAPMLSIAAGRTASLGSNGQNLNTCMRLLFDVPEDIESVKPVFIPFTYFKDRMAIIRSDKFSATMKAGNNAESHNHNDLGHFTVYYRDNPIIIDAGTERYSRVNFSAQRYTLWYTRGSGHNAPVFGNIEQQPGKDYTAVFTAAKPEKVVCDLGKAYPAEAGVKNFLRTLDFISEKIVIEDKIELAKEQDVQIKLLSVAKPEKINSRKLKIGKAVLELDGIELDKINVLPKMNGGWNCVVYEIILKGKKSNYKITFKEYDKNKGVIR